MDPMRNRSAAVLDDHAPSGRRHRKWPKRPARKRSGEESPGEKANEPCAFHALPAVAPVRLKSITWCRSSGRAVLMGARRESSGHPRSSHPLLYRRRAGWPPQGAACTTRRLDRWPAWTRLYAPTRGQRMGWRATGQPGDSLVLTSGTTGIRSEYAQVYRISTLSHSVSTAPARPSATASAPTRS
jgi:hypothetical protein